MKMKINNKEFFQEQVKNYIKNRMKSLKDAGKNDYTIDNIPVKKIIEIFEELGGIPKYYEDIISTVTADDLRLSHDREHLSIAMHFEYHPKIYICFNPLKNYVSIIFNDNEISMLQWECYNEKYKQ